MLCSTDKDRIKPALEVTATDNPSLLNLLVFVSRSTILITAILQLLSKYIFISSETSMQTPHWQINSFFLLIYYLVICNSFLLLFGCVSKIIFNNRVANSDSVITTVPTTLSTLNHVG